MNSQSSPKKYVYLFNEFDEAMSKFDDDWDTVRGLLGGKGANLLDATRLGIPVPPGFTVSTEGCNDYLAADETFPEDLWEQALEAVTSLEAQTGKKFGDIENPLLVSCRSGARFSMPGMMDTILNIGLNDEIAANIQVACPRIVLIATRDAQCVGSRIERNRVDRGVDVGAEDRLAQRTTDLTIGERSGSECGQEAAVLEGFEPQPSLFQLLAAGRPDVGKLIQALREPEHESLLIAVI